MKVSRSSPISGDAAAVKALLAWARAEGIELHRVTVGVCTVDLGAARPAASGKPIDREPRPAIYQTMGGELYREALESGELQPVVGRR